MADKEEPYWAIVLNYIYETNSGTIPECRDYDGENPVLQELERETDLSQWLAREGLLYCTDKQFLKLVRSDGVTLKKPEKLRISDVETAKGAEIISLSNKGFEVAHEREIRMQQQELQQQLQEEQHQQQEQQRQELEKQNRINATVGAFTIVLATGILAQAMLVLPDAPPRFQQTAGATLLLGIGVAMIALYRGW